MTRRHGGVMTMEDIADRVSRMEAESAIRALTARYCFAIDDHDLEAVAGLFTADARVWSRDGVMDAVGRDAIVRQYEGRFAVLGPSNHVSHDHWVRFGGDPDEAEGLSDCVVMGGRRRAEQRRRKRPPGDGNGESRRKRN